MQKHGEQKDAIDMAFKNKEVASNNYSDYKVFTTEDILKILDVEGIENDILVNFETREIISTVGIEYENEGTFYTQYTLPNGQMVVK